MVAKIISNDRFMRVCQLSSRVLDLAQRLGSQRAIWKGEVGNSGEVLLFGDVGFLNRGFNGGNWEKFG